MHAVVRPGSRPWRLGPGRRVGVPLHAVDLTDADAVRRLVAAVRPSVVLHLAAHGAYESQSDSARILATNVLGTLHLLEAAAGRGVELFVNAGSSSEYGFKSEPMRESRPPRPEQRIRGRKAAQTHLCGLFARRSPSMAIATLRLFSVYGPWEEPTRLIPTVIRRARAGLPLEMVAPDVARDFVFVGDVLRALLDFDRLRLAAGRGDQPRQRGRDDPRRGRRGGPGPLRPPVAGRLGGMPARRWDTTRWMADRSLAGPAPGLGAVGRVPRGAGQDRRVDGDGPGGIRRMMTAAALADLRRMAAAIRRLVIERSLAADVGHIGSASPSRR